MIDEDFKINLIEANTNPCLEINQCPVLARIIPSMLDNAFRIAVDPVFPPPELNFKRGTEFLQENKFTQIFDYDLEKEEIEALYSQQFGTVSNHEGNLQHTYGIGIGSCVNIGALKDEINEEESMDEDDDG